MATFPAATAVPVARGSGLLPESDNALANAATDVINNHRDASKEELFSRKRMFREHADDAVMQVELKASRRRLCAIENEEVESSACGVGNATPLAADLCAATPVQINNTKNVCM